jgi:hypothetical protein
MASKKTTPNQQAKQQGTVKKRIPGRPFPKGVSGNPKGRPPKGQTFKDIFEKVLDDSFEVGGKRYYGKEAICRKLVALGMAGDRESLKIMIDRIDGKARQAVELTGAEGEDIFSAFKDLDELTLRKAAGPGFEPVEI